MPVSPGRARPATWMSYAPTRCRYVGALASDVKRKKDRLAELELDLLGDPDHEIAALRGKLPAIPFFDANVDLRYRHRELERKPFVMFPEIRRLYSWARIGEIGGKPPAYSTAIQNGHVPNDGRGIHGDKTVRCKDFAGTSIPGVPSRVRPWRFKYRRASLRATVDAAVHPSPSPKFIARLRPRHDTRWLFRYRDGARYRPDDVDEIDDDQGAREAAE
jgi:hypothetical protein